MPPPNISDTVLHAGDGNASPPSSMGSGSASVVSPLPLDEDTNHQWANVEPRREAHNWYIHKVPSSLKVGGNERFEPVVVSIGPYHREQANLKHGDAENQNKWKVTENHKKQYLHDLLSRDTPEVEVDRMRNIKLTSMVEKMKELEANARECYSEIIDLDRDDFVKMLILDGCFILELFYKYKEKELGQFREQDKDGLFNNRWMLPSLHRDLVLLENQIPFNVLEALFEIAPKLKLPNQTQNIVLPYFSIQHLIARFFRPILPDSDREVTMSTSTGKHFTDILRTHMLSQAGVSKRQTPLDIAPNRYWEHTACATELRGVGAVFCKEESNKGLLNIQFKDGYFKIPPFYFGRYWSVLFANMIALEQCRRDYEARITSYAFLLDNLIDSGNDVKVFRDSGIIRGSNQEDETIADIVNSLCKLAVYDRFYYDDVFGRVNVYRKKWFRPWRAVFIRNFFHIPWKGFSILAAVILLVVSLAQSIHDFL